jgi:hypothetical protein
LLVEKIPLFALSALSCIATLLIQLYSAGAIDQLPLAWRLNNAAVTYVAYIGRCFGPLGWRAFYPHPNDQLPLWQVILAITFLISVSLLAIQWRRERPYILTGWFWYVGMACAGEWVVQAGEQGRADRYNVSATDWLVCSDRLDGRRAPLAIGPACPTAGRRHRPHQ